MDLDTVKFLAAMFLISVGTWALAATLFIGSYWLISNILGWLF